VTVIELRDCGVQYENQVPIFEHLSIQVNVGEKIGIAGESGCGKTTLLKAVARLLPSTARVTGRCETDGRIGYIPQVGLASLSPYLTIAAQLTELTRSREETVRLLKRVELAETRHQEAYPHQLSGGERQRVLAVQALALRPEAIVADEPTSNLDPQNEAMLLRLLDGYCNETGAGILIASHRERVFQALGCHVHRLTPALQSDGSLPAPVPPTGTLVRIRNLTKTYFTRDWLTRTRPVARALDQVSLDIGVGENVAIVGPSGAGKSTLARLVAGRESSDSGWIEWAVAGSPPDRVQLVQQEPSDSLNPRHSIADVLKEAGGAADAQVLPRIRLPREWIGRKVSDLSEGQRARVAIARCALRLRFGLLVLDESLSGLDPSTRSHIVRFLRERQKEQGLSVLLITHDPEIAGEMGARVVRMASGRVAA
jgi:peptide/nickel transport system ATP-binding protein